MLSAIIVISVLLIFPFVYLILGTEIFGVSVFDNTDDLSSINRSFSTIGVIKESIRISLFYLYIININVSQA